MTKMNGASGEVITEDPINITAWTLDIATDTIKTTDSESSIWDEYTASGLKEGTGTFDAFFETATSDIPLAATTLILRKDINNYYTCTAIITGNTSTTDIPGSEAVKKTYSFTTYDTISPTSLLNALLAEDGTILRAEDGSVLFTE